MFSNNIVGTQRIVSITVIENSPKCIIKHNQYNQLVVICVCKYLGTQQFTLLSTECEVVRLHSN